MNLKDLVEVCTQYEVKRVPLNIGRTDNLRLYGLCCPDTRQILLEKNQDHMELRDSFIHESLHALHYIKGDLFGVSCREQEKLVRYETKKLMRELYGKR